MTPQEDAEGPTGEPIINAENTEAVTNTLADVEELKKESTFSNVNEVGDKMYENQALETVSSTLIITNIIIKYNIKIITNVIALLGSVNSEYLNCFKSKFGLFIKLRFWINKNYNLLLKNVH